MASAHRPAGNGRLFTGVAWALLLLGLWLWGKDSAGVPGAPATGDVAAAGRPAGGPLPSAHEPLKSAAPTLLEIPSLGIAAPVVPRGLDTTGAVDPPPYGTPNAVGWFAPGAAPGTDGVALLAGHVDTPSGPAVFHGLSVARPGARVEVTRTDGSVAVFTVDDVRTLPREGFDAEEAYGQRRPGRPELRLITCGGTFDRAAGSYTANVVVSAHLTGVRDVR